MPRVPILALRNQNDFMSWSRKKRVPTEASVLARTCISHCIPRTVHSEFHFWRKVVICIGVWCNFRKNFREHTVFILKQISCSTLHASVADCSHRSQHIIVVTTFGMQTRRQAQNRVVWQSGSCKEATGGLNQTQRTHFELTYMQINSWWVRFAKMRQPTQNDQLTKKSSSNTKNL